MARSKFRIDPEQYAGAPSVSEGATEKKKEEEQRSQTEAQAENKSKKTATAKHFIQLNVGDYKDYLDVMSKADGRPKTKYIFNLIKEDAERRREEYKVLKDLERLRRK